MAQLKLLRSMQAEVNQKTEAFRSKHPNPDRLDDQEKAELQMIRKEQQEVADLMEELLRPADDPGDAPGDNQSVAPLFRVLPRASEDPPGQEEPPVRLKKKGKAGAEAPKPAPAKQPVEQEKKPAAPEDKQPKPDKQPEGNPDDNPDMADPEGDENEVLQRISQNMRSVEEKLANKELGEGTRQTQEDILKDLDSLIKMAENPPPEGGQGEGQQDDQPPPQDGQPHGRVSLRKQKQEMGRQSRSGGKQRGSRTARGNQRRGGQQPGGQQPGGMPQNPPEGMAGNTPGGGGKSAGERNPNADLYKDAWGHLPETLRAQMDAYANDKKFMDKYDELIKRYYRSIAEQGRRKEK